MIVLHPNIRTICPFKVMLVINVIYNFGHVCTTYILYCNYRRIRIIDQLVRCCCRSTDGGPTGFSSISTQHTYATHSMTDSSSTRYVTNSHCNRLNNDGDHANTVEMIPLSKDQAQ